MVLVLVVVSSCMRVNIMLQMCKNDEYYITTDKVEQNERDEIWRVNQQQLNGYEKEGRKMK